MANQKRNRREELELKLQEVEFTPPTQLQKLGAEVDQIATDLANLPLPAQLAILRLVAPKVLEGIDRAARDTLLDELTTNLPSNH